MNSQPTENEQTADSSSTLDEIKALAPLSEEWWLASKRKLGAGKQVVSAEWGLTKHAFAVTIFLGLCLTAAMTSLLFILNGVALYLMVHYRIQHWIIASVLIAANVILVTILITTIKRVVGHINMSKSLAILGGENRLLAEEENNE